MSKYNYSELEHQINNVLVHQSKALSNIKSLNTSSLNKTIEDTESFLKSLGYEQQLELLKTSNKNTQLNHPHKVVIVPSWEKLCKEAEMDVGKNHSLEDLFTPEELLSNEWAIHQLNYEYNQIHHLDKNDIAISVVAGMLGAAIDILLVGIPKKTPEGLKGGTLANFIRNEFDKRFPPEEMEKLANSKMSKVPYDAQDNRHTTVNVDGLSAYYHRLLSLGHDPLLGFLFGVSDILTGRMTTIDKNGKIISQIMDNYKNRQETDIFSAIVKQVNHLKSDLTTSMGLPAPMMSLFNLMQFGKIGKQEQTIAEIVQGMYFEGYDFIHFCTLSVPVMITEAVIRMGYAIKRITEGNSLKQSIPFTKNRETKPKLATMLFIAHSASAAINAGKVYFTGNPIAINYPQWLAFTKLSFQQLKWAILEKPSARDKYVRGVLDEELDKVMHSIDTKFDDISKNSIIVFD